MPIAAAFINRALADEPWASEKLAAHAGRTLKLRVGPANITMAIDSRGAFVDSDAPPDLTLTFSPLEIPGLLADPARFKNHLLTPAHVDGDATLAATIADLGETLPWFAERFLTRALGPIVGIRVADAGRRLLELPAYAAQRFGASTASYLRDEAGLVVGVDDVRDFAAELNALTARIDELTERVARLHVSTSPVHALQSQLRATEAK